MDDVMVMGEDVLRPAPSSINDNWDLQSYVDKLHVKVIHSNKEEIEFDMIGINAAMINSFRRILLSEVPTMAVEKVTVYQNKTVMQDEVMAHRLGLIPLKADARLFQYRIPGDPVGTDRDTLHYELKVKCTKNPHCRAGHYRHEDMYINHQILSKDIKWVPYGGQSSLYKEEDMGPMYDDILLLKMRPGHELHVKMTAIKSNGRDHAKFSPVGTASYRLLPFIKLVEEVEGEKAFRLQKCFSKGVIRIESRKGKNVAVVDNPRLDMCSRNVLNEPDLRNSVVIGRVKDHFIFSIESVVNIPPHELFREAVKVLKKKCTVALSEVKKVGEN
ncbi:DNA-directed RNA polymerases I and III subunit RPAC1 [Cimex lectularius]|uniref:DNA-directed RNA polymerases I and III subunit RPAC1 n=1 Tax=Cimex lectularius TaxID=79782 RepID=A0A8I6RQ21_CIMLE|nr:DNA-directed RNA polymerases I and III subunit RPAC1 [Cimex lectularius]